MRAPVHACVRACPRACVCACAPPCMLVCVHAPVHACVHACPRACVCACMRVRKATNILSAAAASNRHPLSHPLCRCCLQPPPSLPLLSTAAPLPLHALHLQARPTLSMTHSPLYGSRDPGAAPSHSPTAPAPEGTPVHWAERCPGVVPGGSEAEGTSLWTADVAAMASRGGAGGMMAEPGCGGGQL